MGESSLTRAIMPNQKKMLPRCVNSRERDPRRLPVSSKNPSGPRSRRPYKNAGGQRTTYQQRVSARYAPQPPCACGCGGPAQWSRHECAWAKYAKGHYRKPAQYKDRDWLYRAYVEQGQTMQEIADQFGVNRSVIRKFVVKFDIPTRDKSAARMGRKVGHLNPSWKGGVADWDYSADWKSLARTIRDRDKWTCQLCGDCRAKWGKNLHVHHIDGNKLNNDPLNLISLCATCHPRGKKAEDMAPRLRLIAEKRGGDAK